MMPPRRDSLDGGTVRAAAVWKSHEALDSVVALSSAISSESQLDITGDPPVRSGPVIGHIAYGRRSVDR
jgi:hypothetical protein